MKTLLGPNTTFEFSKGYEPKHTTAYPTRLNVETGEGGMLLQDSNINEFAEMFTNRRLHYLCILLFSNEEYPVVKIEEISA